MSWLGDAWRCCRLQVADGDGSERLAFRHGVVREHLLADLSPSERARIHALLGTALETNATGVPAPVVEIAYDLDGAATDDWRRSLRYGVAAARVASDAGVHEDVVGLAGRTLAVLARAGDPDPAGRLDLRILLGGALRALGHRRGDELLWEAFAEAAAVGDGVRMADAALAFSSVGALSDEWATDDLLLQRFERAADAIGPAD